MAFRVYGMTEHEARRIAQRQAQAAEESRTISGKPPFTAEEWREVVAKNVEKLMDSKREAPLSAIYDAPQFCEQFIELAKRSGRCRGLHIRRPVKVEATRRGKPVEKTVWQEC